mmetsp:Transcript_11457/g.41937  ORF Transcript_11457/g.41937 Transcript_11457/m.41937 type:complete len:432 (+) Transcript_11457:212-1507(+)
MADATEGGTDMVPITREYLRKFFEEHPAKPLDEQVDKLADRMLQLIEELEKQRQGKDSVESTLFPGEMPKKIDQSLWLHREQCEEILDLVKAERRPAAGIETLDACCETVTESVSSCFEMVKSFQDWNTQRITDLIKEFLPTDFRGQLFIQQQERSEARKKEKLAELEESDCTIREKYEVLWQQQMERRKMLATLGASPAFQMLLKYVAGVPEVLLEFLTTINDTEGPLEEQRIAYGPPLYKLSDFVLKLRVLLHAYWETYSAPQTDILDVVSEVSKLYQIEFQSFLEQLKRVFEESPFLISAEDAKKAGGTGSAMEEYLVGRASTYEVEAAVDSAGFDVGWEFKCVENTDIGFSITFTDEGGAARPILPPQRVSSHKGDMLSTGKGTYKLIFDNTDSYLIRKTIQYRLVAVPPLSESMRLPPQEIANAAD